jgi:hypothetical protein
MPLSRPAFSIPKGGALRNLRKTHCPQGHPYEGDNLIFKVKKNGVMNRLCRICTAEYQHRYYERRKADAGGD